MLRAELSAILHEEGWPPEHVPDMLVATTELATNAIMHAGTGFNVACSIDGAATVEVEDGNPRRLPCVRAPGSSAEPGGFGLRIVDELAREWNVEVRDDTKLVQIPGRGSASDEVPNERGQEDDPLLCRLGMTSPR